MANTYAVIENGQPMDGEFYTRRELFRVMRFVDYNATIFAFDLAEGIRDHATSMRDVTEDMAVEWWHGEGINETCEMIEAGKGAPGLAYRYFSDECAAYEMRVAS